VYSGLNANDKVVEWSERAVEEQNGELVLPCAASKSGDTSSRHIG
jgi:hypothetical protein